jgi:hypothetical protein
MENDGFGPHLLDSGFDFQKIPITAGPDKFAVSLDNGQTKAFLDVPERFFRRQSQRPEIFFNGPMTITEVADKINNAVGVGVAEADPDLAAVTIIFPTHDLTFLIG